MPRTLCKKHQGVEWEGPWETRALRDRVSHCAQPHPMPPTFNPTVLNLWLMIPLANLYLQKNIYNS